MKIISVNLKNPQKSQYEDQNATTCFCCFNFFSAQ